MNHLDEGTIHAWLDGALDAAQSAEIQSHVSACAECAAKVAEARGLIAASSRILTALDDVPANVVPKRAPVAAAAKPRRFRAVQWGYAAAAGLALVILWRSGDMRQPPPGIGEINIDAAVKAALESIPAIAALPAVSTPQPLGAPPAVAPSRPAAPPAPQAAAEVALQRARVDSSRGQERAEASRTVATPLDARATSTNALGGAVGTPAVGAAVAADAMAKLSDASTPVVGLSGCYRIPVERTTSAFASGAGAPTANVGTRERRAAASSAAPARASGDQVRQTLVNMIRLDTVPGASGFVARSLSDTTVGTWRLASGSTALVTLLRDTFTVAINNRVPCPPETPR